MQTQDVKIHPGIAPTLAILWYVLKNNIQGDFVMTARTTKPASPVTKTGTPPYPFRTFWALLLLGVNVLVAAIYAGYLKI